MIKPHYKHRLDKLINFCVAMYPYSKHKQSGYHHHHIIPRSWGGTNNKDNIITVPSRIHYLIHMLLTKAYPSDVRMAHAWLLMYRTSNTSKLYEKHRAVCECIIKQSFTDGDRVSTRKGMVMAKHVKTGVSQLVPKSEFDNSDEWVGISRGVARSEEFKTQVGLRSSSSIRTVNQRQAAKQNINNLKVSVTCICCKKTRTYPNHVKHLLDISPNRGKPLSEIQRSKMLSQKRAIEETQGTLKKVYKITIDGKDWLHGDILQLCNHLQVSLPTARKRASPVFTGIYNRNGTLMGELPTEYRTLEWFKL